MVEKPMTADDASALRQKAEELARKNALLSEDIEHLTPEQLQQILHELHVHQIQLEMQNEELRRIQGELENARARYFDLYDLAPVGYLTLSEAGLIVETNLAAAGLLEISRKDLIKQPISRFIFKEDQDTFYLHRKKLFSTGMPQDCELRMLKKGTAIFWGHLAASLAEDENGSPLCRIVLSDVSAQKKIESDLQYLSMRDGLTGIYNRAFFEESMDQIEQGRQYPVSILMADVDNLKHINDSHGHAAGDHLLKRAAHLFTISFRADDVIARVGGDEFAILMPNTSADAAEISLLRFHTILQEHNNAYSEIPIKLSCGIATAAKKTSLSDIFKLADSRMYQEKRGRHVDIE